MTRDISFFKGKINNNIMDGRRLMIIGARDYNSVCNEIPNGAIYVQISRTRDKILVEAESKEYFEPVFNNSKLEHLVHIIKPKFRETNIHHNKEDINYQEYIEVLRDLNNCKIIDRSLEEALELKQLYEGYFINQTIPPSSLDL